MQETPKEISKKSKSSFYYAFNLLPAEKRDAMNTVYAFCRKTDDIVDEDTGSGEQKYKLLFQWRDELELAFRGSSQYQLMNTLAGTINRFNIPTEPFFELIRGMEMDLVKTRYQDFQELELYCYRVASTVGLMCIEIFGYKHPSARDFAFNLGIALQLTNIIRDVAKDAANGRIYIPVDELHRFHYTEEDILNQKYNAHFVNLMEFQVARAKSYFVKATESLHLEDKSSMFAARAMQHIYYRVLQRVQRANYDVYHHQIKLSKMEKVGISLGVWAKYNLVY